jgi:hypothetical protein
LTFDVFGPNLARLSNGEFIPLPQARRRSDVAAYAQWRRFRRYRSITTGRSRRSESLDVVEQGTFMDETRLAPEVRQRIRLRSGVARVEQNLSDLSSAGASETRVGAMQTLVTSWHDLVALLAIPEEPERRDCPFCGGPIVRDATRCIHCWKKSSVEPTDGIQALRKDDKNRSMP